MPQFANKQVVIGLGKTGISCVRFLRRLDCDVVVVDTRKEPPALEQLKNEFPEVRFYSGKLSQFDFSNAEELFVSPGLSIKEPALAKAHQSGVLISGDIELFARAVSAPVIAVTGSNGKSTVVTLLGELLKVAGYRVCVAGNVGLPVLDALTEQQNIDLWVLELSSFQLETIQSLTPQVAINLNVTEDHMDRYDSLDEYAMAKQRIFDNCEAGVFWQEDNRARPVHSLPATLPFGGQKEGPRGRFYLQLMQGEWWVMDGSNAVICQTDVRLKGTHNLLNIAAVLTTLVQLGIDYQPLLAELKQFAGLPHRCQWVAEINGVNWYNDSKSTNPGSAIAALEGLSGTPTGQLIWLAGGDGKGADFSLLQSTVQQHVGLTLVFGRDKQQIASVLAGVGKVEVLETMAQAIERAYAIAQAGDMVLLSPACASLDQFTNYEQRGDQFVSQVQQLGASSS